MRLSLKVKRIKVISLGVAMLMLLTHFLVIDNYFRLRESFKKDNEVLAYKVAQDVEQYIREKYKLLEMVNRTYEYLSGRDMKEEEIHGTLKRLTIDSTDMDFIAFTNKDGRIVSICETTDEYEVEAYMGRDLYGSSFKDIKKEGRGISNILFGENPRKELLIISICNYREGKFIGTTALAIEREKFIEIGKRYTKNLTDYTYIVDGNLNVIYHPQENIAQDIIRTSTFVNKSMDKVKAHQYNTEEILSPLDGTKKLVSYRGIDSGSWGIYFVRSNSKIYPYIYKKLAINISILILTALLIYYIQISYLLKDKRERDLMLYSEEKLNTLRDLAVGFAHTVRNPLATIKSYIQLTSGAMSDIALKEVDRISEIIERYLALTKDRQKEAENGSLEDTFKFIFVLIEAMGLLGDIYIESTIEENLPRVKVSRDNLDIILTSLLRMTTEMVEPKGKIILRGETWNEYRVLIRIEVHGQIHPMNADRREVVEDFLKSSGGSLRYKKESQGLGVVEVLLPILKNKTVVS